MLSVLQFSSKWNCTAPHISPEATLSYKRLLCKHWNEFSVVPIEIPWNAVSCWFVGLHQNNENMRIACSIMQGNKTPAPSSIQKDFNPSLLQLKLPIYIQKLFVNNPTRESTQQK